MIHCMSYLTRRRLTPEWMDAPNADPDELARALGFIRLVNRRFPFGLGGAAATIWHLDRLSRNWPYGRTMTLLDVGTGSADIPLAILAWADRRGHNVRITAIDLHETTLNVAREQVAQRGEESRIEIMRADALKLHEHFQPGSFHYAHAAMFLHHLDDMEAMTVLRIMDRLSTQGVIWNDLVRSRLTCAAVRGFGFALPRMARHDAIASFDAAFTKREALDLAQRAGLAQPKWRRHLLYRFTIVSEARNGRSSEAPRAG